MSVKLPNVKIIDELINNQLNDIAEDKKLSLSDMIRMSKYLNSSIFDKNKCSIWQGYITGLNKKYKSSIVVYFYFQNNKTNLHRLLYANYKGPIEKNEYIKYTCDNPNICCNIHHIMKFKYSNNKSDDIKEINKPINKSKEKFNITKSTYTLYFD